jgi:type 2 lantibiotic biosynthesis protein LanM
MLRDAPWWWAPGLSLADRAALPTADHAVADHAPADHGAERLVAWRQRYASNAEFVHRLADTGLDEAALAALLAETPRALAARAGKPAWASFAEQAAGRAPGVPAGLAGQGGGSGPAAFAAPLRPLTDLAREQAFAASEIAAASDIAASDSSAPDAGHLHQQFTEQLGHRLGELAARVLVVELHRARRAGELAGATPHLRFADFLARTGTRDGLSALFAGYPVLARLLAQTAQRSAAAYAEMLARLAADRPALTGLLGGAPGPLREVAADAGDPHQGGRSVAVLTFAGGAKLVYKPRPLTAHQHFRDLLGWLDAAVPGLGLRTPACLARDGYGWQEYVPARSCADRAEVERFYRRTGALLALLYAVDGTDVHFENLIACGDQPVLVDTETLFHPVLLGEPATGPDPAGRALAGSVLRTALLPQLLLGEYGALDVSGVGGDGGMYPTDQVSWSGSGTDLMRLVREPLPFAGGANRPRLHGRDTDPGEYAAALLHGFRLAYDALIAGRTDLVGPGGLLTRFAGDQIRVIARHTAVYARLAGETTHPDLMRDALDRDRELDLLYQDDHLSLAGHEVADLWAGDTPLFTSRPDSADLWTAAGERLPGVLPCTGLAAVTAKLGAMGALDRDVQEWYVSAALATRTGPLRHAAPAMTAVGFATQAVAAVPDPRRLLTAACGIADELVSRALHGGGRANWVGMEPVEDRHWAVLPLGAGLAHGYPGVALFLAQTAQLSGIGRYRELARLALRPVPRLIEVLAADPERTAAVGPGGFAGLGGICYALARLATLLDDPEVGTWLAAAVDVARAAGPADPADPADAADRGVSTGYAGGLAAMLAVHTDTGLPAAADVAAAYAGHLLSSRRPGERSLGTGALTGFACGPAGAGWALLRYAATSGIPTATGRTRHPALADGLAADEFAADSAAVAPPAGTGGTDLGWCGGLAGQVLARLDMADGAPAPRQAGYLDRAAGLLLRTGPLPEMSLCHGELGVLEALAALAADPRGWGRYDRGTLATALAARTGVLLDALDEEGARCGTPNTVATPGLLCGLAGIGYGLLRLAFPERVPSVLLLEAGTRTHQRSTTKQTISAEMT